jgi:putative cell wall-binding protein
VVDFGLEYFRIFGADRYMTSISVAMAFFSDRQRLYSTFAYGHNFPDGLSAGPLCIQYGAPLILLRNGMKQEAVTESTAYIKYGARSRHAIVLGGPTLISDELVKTVMDIHAMG